MKKQTQTIFLSLCIQSLVLVFMFSLARAAGNPTLEAIEFEKSSADEEQVTFQLNGVYIPKIFAMKGKKPRVVFDFPDTKPARTLQNTVKTEGRFIKQIRMGIHKGEKPKTRVVFDLTPDMEIDFEQNFNQQKNKLTVTVYSSGSKPEAPQTKPTQPTTETVPEKIVTLAPSPFATQQPQAAPESPSEPQPPKATEKPSIADDIAAPPIQEPEVKKDEPVDQPRTASSTDPILHSVTFDNSTNRGEMVQFKLNDFYPPVVFGIEEGLPRVVCDFKDTKAGPTLEESIKANGRHVRSIRIGKHQKPNKIRVVIDLEPNTNYDLQQVFFKEDNLFVIIVNDMHNTPPVTELEKPLNN